MKIFRSREQTPQGEEEEVYFDREERNQAQALLWRKSQMLGLEWDLEAEMNQWELIESDINIEIRKSLRLREQQFYLCRR